MMDKIVKLYHFLLVYCRLLVLSFVLANFVVSE